MHLLSIYELSDVIIRWFECSKTLALRDSDVLWQIKEGEDNDIKTQTLGQVLREK